MNPDPDSSDSRPTGDASLWLTLDAIVDAPAWSEALLDPEAFARETAATCFALVSDKSAASFSVLFTDDAQLQALNRQFRGLDKPTNVLSFQSLSTDDGLGDIAIAYETTAREAIEQGKSFQHHARHLIAHGMLHLLGYDHEVDSEAEAMEALERGVLARFGISDPYAVRTADDRGIES